MDLERLDEALAHVDAYGRFSSPIVDAARAYRDLLANGEKMVVASVTESRGFQPGTYWVIPVPTEED